MPRPKDAITAEIRLTDKRLRRAKKAGKNELIKYHRHHLAGLQKELEEATA